MNHSILLRTICYWLILATCSTKALATSTTWKRSTEKQILPDQTGGQLECHTQNLEPQFAKSLKTRRVKVSYPAVSVPPMTIDDGMAMFHELDTYLPCHDCLILAMEADVEYKDGTQATPASSFWLHHAVFVNRGKLDHFCGPESWGQRFYAVGNERTPIMMTSSGKRAEGYHIQSSDQVAMSVDLMNMSHEPKEVIFTVTYEFIEKIPKKFITVEPVWLDIGGCETSSAPAQPDAVFDFTSPSWSSSLSGKIVSVAGHLHDGGTHLQVLKNNEIVCDALPKYTSYNVHADQHPEEHISTISTCSEIGKVSLEEKWKVKAFYNTSLHKPMANMDGILEPVMGIAIMYIGLDREDKHGWCGWLAHRNFILPGLCLSFGTLLAIAWFRQRQERRRLQFSQERSEWWRQFGQDLKLPLLSPGAE